MSNQLTLTQMLNNTTILVSPQPRLLYLLIETGCGQAGHVRAPVHLALVVDKSDSMLIRIAPPELQRLWWSAVGCAKMSWTAFPCSRLILPDLA